jgi:hypothetical protein
LQQQRHTSSNAAPIAAPWQQQRCNNSVTTTTTLRIASPSLLQQYKRQRCHRYDLSSSDVRLTFVGLSSDDPFKPCHPAPYHPNVLRPVIICIVLPSCPFIQHLFDFRLTFV